MQDIFGVRTDINNTIILTEDFLRRLYRIKEKYPKSHLNPNYVNLLNKIFQNPDILFFHRT